MAKLKQHQLRVGPIYTAKANNWNRHLSKAITEHNLNQTELADLVNKRFEKLGTKTNYAQKDASAWVNLGTYDGTGYQDEHPPKGFPKYEVMIQIADVLKTTVEHLTGETFYNSFKAEYAGDYLGLSSDAIESLRSIASHFDGRFFNDSLEDHSFDDNASTLLDRVIVSPKFRRALDDLDTLDRVRRQINNRPSIHAKVEAKYGPELLEKAQKLIHSQIPLWPVEQPFEDSLSTEDFWNSYRERLEAIGINQSEFVDVLDAASELDMAVDAEHEALNDWALFELACRYQAKQVFAELVDELFPPLDINPLD